MSIIYISDGESIGAPCNMRYTAETDRSYSAGITHAADFTITPYKATLMSHVISVNRA